MRLSAFPYVIVRIGCSNCSRRGLYRLARLADRYGSEADIGDVLQWLSGDCKGKESPRVGIRWCGAYFVDLKGPRPPDVPPAKMALKVVKGGRG